MVYWKIDDETIRCLINEDEIDKMGFSLEQIKGDQDSMEEFLNVIMDESHKYIEWNTENGIQNYAARALPADQYLITISCTFIDEAIDKDLKQIERMVNQFHLDFPQERLDEIAKMTGPEKEEAFARLSQDLHKMCIERLADRVKQGNNQQSTQAPQEAETEVTIQADPIEQEQETQVVSSIKISFSSMDQAVEFASLINLKSHFESQFYRLHDQYIILADFDPVHDNVDLVTLLIMAEEYGAVCEPLHLYRFYLKEHGTLLIAENALHVLKTFSK